MQHREPTAAPVPQPGIYEDDVAPAGMRILSFIDEKGWAASITVRVDCAEDLLVRLDELAATGPVRPRLTIVR